MLIRKEDQEDLIKRQMKTIDDLQEKVKLQQFDISKTLLELRSTKDKLRRRNKVINDAKREIYEIKKTGDIRRLDDIIRILKETEEE